jgi:hypothetical protein
MAVKPASRASDRCELTRYDSHDERFIAKALVEPSRAKIGSGQVTG